MVSRLPVSLSWVQPLRSLPQNRYLHLARAGLEVTLCGRVRPGPLATPALLRTTARCPRCAARALLTWP